VGVHPLKGGSLESKDDDHYCVIKHCSRGRYGGMSFPIPEGSKSPHRSRGIFERFISPNSRQRPGSNVGTSPSMAIPSSGKEMRLIPRSPRYRVDRSLVDYDLLSPSPSPSFSGLPSPNFDSLALSPQRSQSHGFAASYHEQTDADRMRRGSRRSRNTPGSPLPSRHTRKGSEAAVQLRSFRPGFEVRGPTYKRSFVLRDTGRRTIAALYIWKWSESAWSFSR
jgi:hypothetical protein